MEVLDQLQHLHLGQLHLLLPQDLQLPRLNQQGKLLLPQELQLLKLKLLVRLLLLQNSKQLLNLRGKQLRSRSLLHGSQHQHRNLLKIKVVAVIDVPQLHLLRLVQDKIDKALKTKVLKVKVLKTRAAVATVKVINNLLLHLISQVLIQIGARMDRRVKVLKVKVVKTKALKDKVVKNKAVNVKTNPILLLA